jgi:hypothetical protein
MKVGGSLSVDGGTAIGGSIATGKDQGFFFGAGAGIVTEGDQIFIQAGVGKELSQPLGGKIVICPVGNFTYYLEKHGVSGFDLGGGLSGGYPVPMSSENLNLILTGSAQLFYSKVSIDGGLCDLPGADCSDFTGLFGFGAGFIFNNRISLVPQLLIPTEGDLTLLIVATIALGG